MGQCPHRNWSIIGRHATKLVTGDERCIGAQVCGAERSDYTRRAGADNDDVKHLSRDRVGRNMNCDDVHWHFRQSFLEVRVIVSSQLAQVYRIYIDSPLTSVT